MSEPETIEVVRAQPLFESLDGERLARLARRSRVRGYAPGGRVVREGEPVSWVCLILSGSLIAHSHGAEGRDQVAHVMAPGQILGDASLFRTPAWRFNVSAAADGARLLEIEAPAFREAVEEVPALALALIDHLSRKIHDLTSRIRELSIASAITRLARYVLQLEGRRLTSGGFEVALPVAKKDLAVLLAITPEHLSRILRRWSDARLVRTTGRTLTVLNPGLLGALADADDPAPPGP